MLPQAFILAAVGEIMSERSQRNLPIIAEFRANAGKVGGPFADTPLLLLNTIGATSGQARTNPLAYLADGDRVVVFAANGGRDQHPAWYHNLLAHPLVTVELGSAQFQARALIAEEPERTRLYAKMVERNPGFAEFERNANRSIPAVVLERVE
jgi:deazaflavin-dependent oxidoreductase (nitroreductase family)